MVEEGFVRPSAIAAAERAAGRAEGRRVSPMRKLDLSHVVVEAGAGLPALAGSTPVA